MKLNLVHDSGNRPQLKLTRAHMLAELSQRVIGQRDAIEAIVPYIRTYMAGLSPSGRPVGNFLLLGPTGTGKTRTVEALAEVLHGSPRKVLKVDCGEFQMEHEVAKLIGAPPGYLGHRETHPFLTQAKLNAVTTESCPLSIVLFDEIEKAAASMTRLLLGVLDKATLKLGDNTTVDFQRSLIFLTSNIGARAMERQLRPAFGFPSAHDNGGSKLQDVALASAKRHFSPEFINRMDSIVTYQPLPYECLERILDREIVLLQRHIDTQLGSRRFDLHVDKKARKFLLERGCSPEYGARELKRVMTRELTQPLAETVAEDNIRPGSEVCATVRSCGTRLRLRARVLSVLRRSERP